MGFAERGAHAVLDAAPFAANHRVAGPRSDPHANRIGADFGLPVFANRAAPGSCAGGAFGLG